ncbi:hypothetical protein ALT1644_210059 [Alteromonas macleodii]|nr:efflux RND transporter permease subunit [Alteromonas sp. BZK5]MEE3130397.1 efflux RND transporter permease subunit [Pseudomonadota bacterium]|tara:strand:+ start:502 stop:630 length:129 start_codon:yes stop_codon:yes gene_type:complete
MEPFDAALTAAKQRLRPILMTSLTFILGVGMTPFVNPERALP